MDTSTTEDFITLFRGRGDAYGAWEGRSVKEPLTPQHYIEHLGSGPHIGVYPCVPVKGETMCVWGCTDIDYDGPEDAWLLHGALKAVGVHSWVEKTRRGYHVWVFATELVTAKVMRRMFLAAHQVCELNPKEVNPKQEELRADQLGNYVRLPYPAQGSLERYMVRPDGQPIPLAAFVESAMRARVSPDLVASLAGYYKPPRMDLSGILPPMGSILEVSRTLTPLGRAIFKDGPLEGRDRSTTLTHLAHECRKSSLNPNDALMILEDADLRWGKYLKRGPSGQLELVKLLERAYGHMPSS